MKRFAFLLPLLFLLAGCGGGGGSRPIVTPTISVDWPTRTKNLSAPSSALSLTFLFQDTAHSRTFATISGNRSSNLAAHTETYSSATTLRSGTYAVTGTFFADTGESGLVVATVSTTVSVASDGTLRKADGTPLGEVGFTSIVKSVVVAANQSVATGGSVQLTATALDASSNMIALAPGAFSFNVATGGANLMLTPAGVATGVSEGQATVVATVDGVSSAPTTVTVTSSAPPDFVNPGFETPVLNANTWGEPPPAGFTWTGQPGFGVANGSGAWGAGAEAGAQYVFLQSSSSGDVHAGTCEQIVTGFTVGQTYHVTFFMARRNGNVGGNVGAPVTLTANSNVIFPATSPTNDGLWTMFTSQSFTATQTSYDFIFSVPTASPGTDAGTLLDEVHIVAG